MDFSWFSLSLSWLLTVHSKYLDDEKHFLIFLLLDVSQLTPLDSRDTWMLLKASSKQGIMGKVVKSRHSSTFRQLLSVENGVFLSCASVMDTLLLLWRNKDCFVCFFPSIWSRWTHLQLIAFVCFIYSQMWDLQFSIINSR